MKAAIITLNGLDNLWKQIAKLCSSVLFKKVWL